MNLRQRYESASKPKLWTYIVLRVTVIAVMVAQIFNQNWHNVFLCVLTLLLFMLPSIVSRRFKVELPNALEIIIVCFIFSAEVLGEIQQFYLTVPFWDVMLHGVNGFLSAAMGLALVNTLNEDEHVMMHLSPLFVVLTEFGFSMMVGVLWEFFECAMDLLFHTDMQKDTWISAIHSVDLNESVLNDPVHLTIESVAVNGAPLGDGTRYLDIGLYDTMKDLAFNFIGAIVFSIFGWFYVKKRSNFAAHFLLRKKRDDTAPQDDQRQSG